MISMDTKWSVAFAFNAVVYTLLTIFTLSLVVSAFFWPLVCVGSIGFCITQFAHFAAIICTGIWRFSGDGPRCADKDGGWPVSEDGQVTFSDMGDKLKGVFIS